NASGTAAIANLGSGVRIIGSSNNSVVGNLLSGNGAVGVNILAGAVTSNGNVVQGNLIGTDATGNSALGNSGSGIQVTGANNRVGGTTTAARNVISGNGAFGISMFAGSLGGTPFATNGNEVQGNYIGSNSAGTGPVGNALGGISIQASGGSSASNNVVGSAGGASNLIAFNGGDGVTLSTADASPLSGNLILSNSIYSNAGLGIDLTAAFPTDGPTPNDPCDADAGPNNLQTSPVLTSAFASAGVTTIQGTLNSTPNTTFTIQVFSNTECDPSGSGEGETLLGSTTVTTDSSCSGSFKFTTNKPVGGQVFAATATDPAGNTSEFSPCVALGAALADVSLTMSASTTTPKPGDKVTYTITVTNNGPEIANNVVVTDNLPDHLSFASCASTGGGVCGGTGNSRMVTFPLMATNASATITFEATVNSSVANGTRIDNTATVTSAASDPIASNNTATASLTVSTNPISINCPANVSVTAAQGQTSAVVNYSSPTVVGNPPGVTLTCSPPSGSNFPLGTTTVNCTATDAANNKGSCGFTVTVNPFVPNNPSPDKTAIDFGSPLVLPLQTPTSDTFAITNTATASVDLTFASIRRTGGDVSAGKITNPDDSGLFSVFAVNPGSADTQLNVGAIVTIPAGQRSFRVMFNPAVPPVAPRTSNLAANQVLPDVVTSTLNFTTGDGRTLTINLTGRVSTALQLIDPVDTSRPPDVTFTKSGNQFTLTYSVFDSNQDVSRASYQFLDSSGQPAGQPIEVILAQALQPLGLARGQSFTVEQPFSGASSHPEIAGVRVTVFDVETNVSATATLGAAAASVTGAAREQRVTLVLPRRRLHRLTP
ncbi:MAG TPA: HYR domain-containing protein, partial [Blastocatellia bacterium]|nr:HYR domain-containing protein [Blastocatellia bacterium]